MIDYYLKFTDEEAANAVLFTDDTPNYVNISVIGAVEGLDGWHVNVRADESPELEQYRIFPTTPMRVWA